MRLRERSGHYGDRDVGRDMCDVILDCPALLSVSVRLCSVITVIMMRDEKASPPLPPPLRVKSSTSRRLFRRYESLKPNLQCAVGVLLSVSWHAIACFSTFEKIFASAEPAIKIVPEGVEFFHFVKRRVRIP